MKVVIDREQCSGHGRCAAVAPDVFDLDDEGYSFLLVEHIDGKLEEQAREAAATCPERCIHLEETMPESRASEQEA